MTEPNAPLDRLRGPDEVATQFPTPADLMAYEQCMPGATARLVRMAEKEQEHRHQMNLESAKLRQRGQRFGLTIALAFLAVAGVLIFTGHDTAGTIIGSVDLVALVAVFVTGRFLASGDGGSSTQV
ncbi:DUF2335 domain-containing protein [uncultured Pseudonocardia sp.]|uniref:DUF2335 domain-containing protein n=1 Tax=uncultured Pseudonocardia sp. TaxID=211455 RepID=UPI002637D4A3|nr:DUF2335 domain-containing protein [uncultured Pseudonocardia sp.]